MKDLDLSTFIGGLVLGAAMTVIVVTFIAVLNSEPCFKCGTRCSDTSSL